MRDRKGENIMKLNTSEVKSFMWGNLLGDGNLHNGAFITGQINKDLIYFKKKIFERYFGFSKTKITFVPSYIKEGVHRKDTWRIYVSPNKYFKKMESEMYKPKKSATQEMLDSLCPLGLAIWYADDGSTIHVGYNEATGSSSRRRVQICTDTFSFDEVVMIQNYFNKLYGPTSLVKRDKGRHRVQINTIDAQKFLCDISPYFIEYFPSLLYKLDMGYRGESLDNTLYVTKEYKELYLKISSHPNFRDRIKEKLDK